MCHPEGCALQRLEYGLFHDKTKSWKSSCWAWCKLSRWAEKPPSHINEDLKRGVLKAGYRQRKHDGGFDFMKSFFVMWQLSVIFYTVHNLSRSLKEIRFCTFINDDTRFRFSRALFQGMFCNVIMRTRPIVELLLISNWKYEDQLKSQ